MTVNCPGCGQDVPVTEREVTLQAGDCPGCHRQVVLWTSSAGTAPVEEPAPAVTLGHMDGDEECEGTLSLTVGDGNRLLGSCSACGSEFTFRLEGGEEEAEEREENAPARPAPRFGRDRPSFGDREAPRGRPCRKCGGTIQFETGDDGRVTGTCSSCGNSFTLPPRDDRRGGGGGGFRGGGGGYRGGGGFRGGGGGRDRFGGGGGRGFRPNNDRGGFVRRRRSDDDDERPRRRRDE